MYIIMCLYVYILFSIQVVMYFCENIYLPKIKDNLPVLIISKK